MSLGPQIAIGAIGLTRSITLSAAVPQSAPSPSPPGLARECIGLFPLGRGRWSAGGSWRWTLCHCWWSGLLLVYPQIATEVIDLTCLLPPPPPRPQSAPSPSLPVLPRWCIGLLPWARGGGMRGGGVERCGMEMLCLSVGRAWVRALVCRGGCGVVVSWDVDA
ncbi:MAG: hypothetical protein GY832_44235 [Chloroflexi bacterium]|nr:hypothetical protein [Chloroflexota bacterium]